jgi:hypothetical protein
MGIGGPDTLPNRHSLPDRHPSGPAHGSSGILMGVEVAVGARELRACLRTGFSPLKGAEQQSPGSRSAPWVPAADHRIPTEPRRVSTALGVRVTAGPDCGTPVGLDASGNIVDYAGPGSFPGVRHRRPRALMSAPFGAGSGFTDTL